MLSQDALSKFCDGIVFKRGQKTLEHCLKVPNTREHLDVNELPLQRCCEELVVRQKYALDVGSWPHVHEGRQLRGRRDRSDVGVDYAYDRKVVRRKGGYSLQNLGTSPC
ncbi:hypothetical protein AERO9AM_100010 [Aeromicrobium sp. 9AM]|nr:hypothetical protein AERO9AM_100010 [Aeromicrobium sp. 9AM]